MAGGYLTGRMRRRFHDATEHESDVRDGAHGLLVWAGALVVGAIIAVGGIGAARQRRRHAVGTATTAASNVADEASRAALDPKAYFVDTLFRLPAGRHAAPPARRSDYPRRSRPASSPAAPSSGTVSDADKTYLAQLVARNTGLPAGPGQGPRRPGADGGRRRPRPRLPTPPRRPAR